MSKTPLYSPHFNDRLAVVAMKHKPASLTSERDIRLFREAFAAGAHWGETQPLLPVIQAPPTTHCRRGVDVSAVLERIRTRLAAALREGMERYRLTPEELQEPVIRELASLVCFDATVSGDTLRHKTTATLALLRQRIGAIPGTDEYRRRREAQIKHKQLQNNTPQQ